MDSLIKLRIILTSGALVGIAPVTVAFIWLLPVLITAVLTQPSPRYPLLALAITTLALWGCWQAYAAAMSTKPTPPRLWPTIATVIIALGWGVTCTGLQGWQATWLIVFLMPGATATAMLMVAAKRARRIERDCVTARPD